MKNIKFAIIGNGFIAPRHISCIKELGGIIEWICDIDKTKKIERIKFTTNYKDIKDVDWAIICTPNYLHFEIAQYFRNKGIKVLCEKPPVISTKEFENPFKDFNIVLQLRYNSEILKLKEELKNDNLKTIRDYSDRKDAHNGNIVIKVKRDKLYWDGWKGREWESGGILFNLAVHYIDLLIFLFGNKYYIRRKFCSDKLAYGEIDFDGIVFVYHFEIMNTNEGQTRCLKIDDNEVELSKQDNLSFENLHLEVYKNLDNGVMFSDTYNLIKLIEELK